MKARHACSTAAAILIALFITGCSGTARTAEDRTPPSTDESTADLEAIYRARLDSARKQYTDADVRFMTDMIAHHAQALVMASLAPTHGASAEIRTLAARIDNAQMDEIATMQNWLRDRGQPVPEIHIEGTNLMVHVPGDPTMHGTDDHVMHGDREHAEHAEDDHAMLMPGMLTPEQMRALDDARGAEFDRLFLTYMIQHHGGAVTMVEDLFSIDGAAQDEAAFKLASDVQVDQITEIERMERMLKALSDPDRDP